MALTDRAIRNAKPTVKPLRLFDGGGLYLEIAPSGGRWWRLKYRFGGKEKRVSLGVYPEVSLADARGRRDDARKLLAAGTDPSAHRKAEKQDALGRAANSFEAVAREWHAKQAAILTPTHSATVLRQLDANLFPEIGDKPVAAITAPMLLAALRKIEQRGAHSVTRRVIQIASQVFRFAVATGRCERDPAPDLRGALTPRKSRNQPAVTVEELPGLLRAIDAYAANGEKLTVLALRLLALTFVRTTELTQAEWSEFDLDGATWIVPAERMKMNTAHVVPLSLQAVELLREVEALGCGSRYVFPGRNLHRPMSKNTMLFALYRMGYKNKMTGHGFRAVASTMLNEARFHPDVIERQLAHIERNKVRGAYNRAEHLDERRQMMQQWANMLDALKAGAQVVPLQRRAK
jgi:integrase